MADDTQRLATMARRLSADPALAESGGVRGTGAEFADVAAVGSGTRGAANGHDFRQSRTAIQPGKQRAGRLRRSQAAQRQQAVDTLGHLPALYVTPADEQDRTQVGELAQCVQAVTGETVKMAFVHQGYIGEDARQQAAKQGLQLEVVKLPEAKKGFVLLPRRWVVERSFGWMTRFRRLTP